MTALSKDRSLDQVTTGMPNVIQLGVDGGSIIYEGAFVAPLTATGYATKGGGVAATGPVCGIAEVKVDNSAGSDGDLSVNCLTGVFRRPNSSSSALTVADSISACYAEDDQTVRKTGGSTYPLAGVFLGLDSTSVPLVWVGPFAVLVASALESGERPIVYARGKTTGNIASLAAFTVANDGITLVEGDRVALLNQTTKAQNGVYVCGVVGGGTCALTRAPDMDSAGELLDGTLIVVQEGTAGADTAWECTTDGTITIGTTSTDWSQVPFGFGAVGTMTALTAGGTASAGTGLTAARIDHKHATASAVPTGAILVQAADEGSADTFARSDHAHVGASAAPTGATLVQAAAEGVATTYARSDHAHVGTSAAPVDTAGTNAEGAATTFARSNHVHREHDREVRYVVATNVANLAAFTVLQDGVTGVEGDLVLLANQTGADESGVYVLGAVGGGTCALTRVGWMTAADVIQNGYSIKVQDGTLFAQTVWFAVAAASDITVATTAHAWYPEAVTQPVVLVAGTVTITNVPVLSITRTGVVLTRQAANTCVATDGGYHATNGGANGITAGTVGTAAVIVEACVLAGTINNADISTLRATIINR